MNKKEIISRKFQICSNATNDQIFQWEESEEGTIAKKWGIDLDNFKNILIKQDLGDYYKLLLGYLSGEKHSILYGKEHVHKPNKGLGGIEERREHLLELANMLHFLLDDSKGRINFLKINKVTADSFQTENDRVLNSIKESLTERTKKEFRELNGHIDQLTNIEAATMLQEGQDPDWLIQWNNHSRYTDNDERKLIFVTLDIAEDSVYRDLYANDLITGTELKRLLINEYAFDHEIERELTEEYLNKVIARHTPPQNLRGGQEKHYQAKSIMQVLTNVFWTEYFFFEGNSGKTCCPNKLTNQHYIFFSQVFVSWGLFDDFQISIPEDYGIEKKLRDLFSPGPEVFWKEVSPRLHYLKSQL